MSLPGGARFGPYEILAPIGAGGMGEVYRARDSRLNRFIAVKVLRPDTASDPVARSRFDREARAIAALNHPGICILHDIGHDQGTDYLVMEYVEGETLAARIVRGPLPMSVVVDIGKQIADALDFAHRRGLVHRDLKPQNVMIAKSGVKLLDFGLAKLRSSASPSDSSTLELTTPGTVLGTPAYMAPEQLQGKDVDARADIWAFGALLFELVTGTRAFEADSPAATIGAILERDSPTVSTRRPEVPELLSRIIDRCLVKDPEARWQSIGDVRTALGWVSESAKSAAAAAPGRQPLVPWTIAVLIVAALGVVSARWFASRSAGVPPIEERVQIVTPPTTDPFSIALSPDGRRLVVSGSDGKVDRLWLISLDSGSTIALEKTDGATSPFWSSDGASIGFVAGNSLKAINVSTRAVRDLNVQATGWHGATWSGEVIVYAPYSIGGLFRIPTTGSGQSVPLTHLAVDKWLNQRAPKFLPDGTHVLFYAMGSPEASGVYVTDLAGGEPKRLIDHADGSAVPLDAEHVLFVDQGTLFVQRFDPRRLEMQGEPATIAESVAYDQALPAVAASPSGVIAFRTGGPVNRQLVWLDRHGQVLGPLGDSDPVLLAPEVSRDGRQVVFQREIRGVWDLWTMDAERGGFVRLTSDPKFAWCPIWSPRGDRVAFSSNRSGQFDLYEKAAELGAADHLVLASSAFKIPMDWSSNGFLLYRVQDPHTGSDDLWAKAMDRDGGPIAVATTKAEEREGQFSPDGHWVAYQSDEAVSGHFEIYVQRFPEATNKTRVSTGGGAQARWNPNGREIFYIAPDERLMAAPFSVSSSNGGEAIIQAASPLFQTDIALHQVPGANKQQYAVAPDGQRFLVNRTVAQPASAITLILHWTAR